MTDVSKNVNLNSADFRRSDVDMIRDRIDQSKHVTMGEVIALNVHTRDRWLRISCQGYPTNIKSLSH